MQIFVIFIHLLWHAGQFKTQSVIAVLLDLSNDNDANVRAVAAISLGKTGNYAKYINQLISQLINQSINPGVDFTKS